MNFVPCAKWIQKGVAKSVPDKVKLTHQELQAIWSARKDEIERATEDIQGLTDNSGSHKDSCDKYNFEDYDDDTENIQSTFGVETLVALDSPEQIVEAEEDIDSEAEDEVIHPDDNLIVVGHVEEDASVLEVYVYNEKKGDMYVHHDILLPTVPLCLEWLNFEPSQSSPGNLVAVGGMYPEIMVWDLDILNCLEPAFKLGRYSKKNSKKRDKQNVGHTDAVLDISWNQNVPHILASASVDESVIIWDIEHGTVGMRLTDFTDKVQCIKWHPSETQTLLSGCCDKYVRMFDCRIDPAVTQWEVNGEVECVTWNPVASQSWEALVGTDNGTIHCIDCRTNKCKWQFTAHEKEITGLSLHHLAPEVMVSCSTDGYLKLWDVSKTKPSLLSSKAVNSGDLHCLDLNPDIPYLVCTGGNKKSHVFSVTDLRKQISDHQRFYWGQEENQSPLTAVEGTSSSLMESAAAAFRTMCLNQNKSLSKKKKLTFKKKKSTFNSRV